MLSWLEKVRPQFLLRVVELWFEVGGLLDGAVEGVRGDDGVVAVVADGAAAALHVGLVAAGVLLHRLGPLAAAAAHPHHVHDDNAEQEDGEHAAHDDGGEHLLGEEAGVDHYHPDLDGLAAVVVLHAELELLAVLEGDAVDEECGAEALV